MSNSFNILSADNEPTEEQLYLIMKEVLSDVLTNKKKGDIALKEEEKKYKILVSEKYKHLRIDLHE